MSVDTNRDNTKLFFSVGEPSGDLHAARLLRQLGEQASTDVVPRGFGGIQMEAAGCRLDYQLTDLAVVGFVEVLPKMREFFRVADIASEVFVEDRPDAVILVDFPGFNWHIAKRAKALDIPVFYYLPPQLWAWASWRISKMRRYVDHVLCNLPFEYEWYASRGMSAELVGHPFFDEVRERQLDRDWLSTWGSHDGQQVAVLPGSRGREVRSIWPMQIEVIRELAVRHRGTRFLVACLTDEHRRWCEQTLSSQDKQLDLHFFVNRTSEIIEAADCSLMKSGSVSLEMMARGTPAVVVYHVTRTLYEIASRLTHIKSFSLPNLIAGKTVMPEFLGIGNQTGDAIEQSIAAMDRLLGDRDERQRQKRELSALSAQCGSAGATAKAAEVILRNLNVLDTKTVPRHALAVHGSDESSAKDASGAPAHSTENVGVAEPGKLRAA